MKSLKLLIVLITILSCQNSGLRKVSYRELELLNSEYKFNSEINYYFQQTKDVGMAATDYSFVSEHRNLINSLISVDTIKKISPNTLLDVKRRYKHVKAKNYIISQSKKHDFLLINEAHFIPQHRSFLSELLPELSKIGYSNLALEGLNNSREIEKAILKNGYPEIYHGYYIREPEFGNLIRKARKFGFNVFGYDEGSGEDREISGARNIIEKIESFSKKGKTIVLCGWDHIKEGPTGTYWEYALAGRIKEFSGKDPLTINQTQYYERANRKFEDSLYQSIDVTEPSVLIDELGNSIDLESNTDWYDIFVFHPRTKFIEEVPNWILKDKILKEFSIPEVEFNYPSKVLIFEEGDDIQKAVPTYIKELSEKTNTIKVPIHEKNKYKILIANKEIAYLIE